MAIRETVRKWIVADGLWLSRKQRRTFHQPRLRRECLGKLVQIDGSAHGTMRPVPLFPQLLEIDKECRSPHYAPHDDGPVLSLLLGRS